MMVDSSTTPETPMTVVNVATAKDRLDDIGYSSGGWKSEGGRLSCGFSSFRGKKSIMEDFSDVKSSKIGGQLVCLLGIFDSHGGSHAAEYLRDHLFENLLKHPKFMEDTKLAISETYQKLMPTSWMLKAILSEMMVQQPQQLCWSATVFFVVIVGDS